MPYWHAQPTRPNIIYIMSDDHAYQAISAYGYGLNNTPNIDRLADKGMLFHRAFVTNSICGPSRAVMLTGKHSHINGFKITIALSMVVSRLLLNYSQCRVSNGSGREMAPDLRASGI